MGQEIESIFGALFNNQSSVKSTDFAIRKEKIKKLVKYLQDNETEIQEAMFADMKRGPLDTTAELLMVKVEADFALKNLKKWMKPHTVSNSNLSRGTNSYFIYEPKGVVAIFAPWNAPFACTLVPLVGAIAAGNTVLIKPSEMALNSAKVLKKMIADLFQENEIIVVEGEMEVSKQLLELPFNHIYFTGSPSVGKYVMAAASKNLTSVTLELGGKSPVIIDETADIKSAATKVSWGKCANSGQACIAPDYVLIHEKVQAQFIEEAKSALVKMYNPEGKGFETSPEFPRIINERHFLRLKTALDDAISKGAIVEIGGNLNQNDFYISPTILSNVSDDMLIMREEIFGPILPVKSYSKKEDIVKYINEREKPLALYIFSEKKENKTFFLQNTTAGSSVINHNMIQAGLNPNLPFGGVNNSGMGKSIGKATFEGFSNLRSVVEQPTGWRDFTGISLPPYSNTYKKMINYLFKH